MKKNLGPKGQQFPQPVFIIASYNEEGVADAMNAAYACEMSSDHIVIFVSAHQSTDNILARRALTVSPADAAHVVEADYFGIETGRKVNKEQKSSMTFTKSEFVNAPVIEEFPLAMECEVTDMVDLGGEWRIEARIANTRVDEELLDAEGRVDLGAMHPIVYDATRRIYRVVGEEVGQAWSSGRALV